MSNPQVTLGAVNIEAADPAVLAEFWAAVLSSTPSPGGASFYLPASAPGGFAMFIQPATGQRPDRQAMHLDLTVPWGSRQSEVERLIELGATHK